MVHDVLGIKKASEAIGDAKRAVSTGVALSVLALALAALAIALSVYALTRS